ncbi:MAG TPA: type II secretion system minor pseudopilin GspK [Myxococcales bacterium]|nr:type II secretion system minor pseudopilin GspK [Myxococcales bacterium]
MGRAAGLRSRRGVALILVLTTVAILTSIAVDFGYQSRVNLRLAENARDELRAYYLARSAVNLSRLLLHFQRQVDQMGGQLGPILSNVLGRQSNTTGGTTASNTTGGTTGSQTGQPGLSAAPTNLGIRLWEILPIDSNAMSALLGGGDLRAAIATPHTGEVAERLRTPAPLHTFGGFDGSFNAEIVDENSRINVRGLDGLGLTPMASLTQLRAMMSDPKYDFIFEEEDANRDRVRRDDVILAMKDWVDLDETGTAIDPSNPTNPFVNGFSDENAAYDRYSPRYKAKNAPFDSLEELCMVRGVNDRFMAAFGDRLTVWLDVNAKLNINTNDPLQMLTNILSAAANPNDPKLRDPRLLQIVLQEIQVRKMFSFLGLSAQDFVAILKANGIAVNPALENANSPANFLGAISDTFRITATGHVGRIDKKVTAVVRYDDVLGKLLYWKED